jgi:hypothetical protein
MAYVVDGWKDRVFLAANKLNLEKRYQRVCVNLSNVLHCVLLLFFYSNVFTWFINLGFEAFPLVIFNYC